MRKVDHSIYVHVPFCKARCAYCAFSSCVDFSLCEKYFEVLQKEITCAKVDGGVIKTMFWGGGTPSSVEPKYLQKLFEVLADKFDLSQMSEFTVECNPESVTEELLLLLKSIGVNRLSFGLQSANDSTLKRIGRLHTYSDFLQALNLAHRCGFDNVNADLILGLPESCDEFLYTVERVCGLPLTHVSLYALELHDNKAFNKLCESYAHTEDQLADLYDVARDKLANCGFLRYEVSNFAKEGFECKHNLAYWTENRYYGFGAAASGFLDDVRYGNVYDIREYVETSGKAKAYTESVNADEQAYECAMLGLRLQKGVALQEFAERYGKDFFARFPNATALVDGGFLKVEEGRIFVSDDKFYVLNSILTELLSN